MKVKLTKRAKVWHEAGEIVEVSPAEAAFLVQVYAAEVVKEPQKTAKKKK